jgi:hypothetical protein
MPSGMADADRVENTKEQYAALGRFVEEFEAMVSEARECCTELLTYGLSREQKRLVSIPLDHQSLTATPIIEIFRAVFIQIIRDFQQRGEMTEAVANNFASILAKISSKYESLVIMRNNLLHGTWFIGYSDAENPAAETFSVLKYKLTKKGREKIELPKNAEELRALCERCDEVRSWIGVLHACRPAAIGGHLILDDAFTRENRMWNCKYLTPTMRAAK